MIIPLLFVMVVGIVLVLLIVAARSRLQARQGTLLWLLAIAAEKGQPLPQEVEALAETTSGPLYQDLRQLASYLQLGDPLAIALDRKPGMVPQTAVVAAYIGERTGTLPQVLKEAALHQTMPRVRVSTSPLSLGGALLYLWGLVITGIMIIGFLMYWIIPKFMDIFNDFGVSLPDVTISMIQVSGWFTDYWYLFFPLLMFPPVLLIVVAIAYWKGWEVTELGWMSRWSIRWETPGILRGLSHAVAANAPIAVGLEALRQRHHQDSVRLRLERAMQSCEHGEDCWAALSRQKILKGREVKLLQAAERAGNLPWVLRELASTLEDRRRYRWLAVLEVAQPAVVIALGLVVLYVCVSFFMPLVRLIEQLA